MEVSWERILTQSAAECSRNAQTANFVLLAMAIGKWDLSGAAYLLIPISAYFLGAVLSEALPIHVKKFGLVRWDTLLVGIEVLVTFMLGLLPETAPYQITQVAVNFICSMQYNTFRQAERKRQCRQLSVPII